MSSLAASQQPCFIVLNAGSGHNDTNVTADTIREVLTAAGRPHELLLAEQGRDIPRLARKAVELAKAQDGIVVAAGGDGTINAVAQAALGCGQPFAVLPQGTFNYFGRAHGVSQDTRIATEALLTATGQLLVVDAQGRIVWVVGHRIGEQFKVGPRTKQILSISITRL